jgi:type IV secretion system protein VirD4
VIERATYDLLRVALRLAVQLWPLWLFWFVWSLFDDAWRDFLLTFPDRSTQAFVLAYDGWPAVALLGPILLMGMAIAAFRLGLATRLMPFAGIAGVVIATVLTVWPEYQRLAPYLGNAPLFDVVRALNLSAVQAVAVGLIATVAGAPDVAANAARQDGAAPGAGPLRQFWPCRLAGPPRRTPAVSRSG